MVRRINRLRCRFWGHPGWVSQETCGVFMGWRWTPRRCVRCGAKSLW